MEDGFYYFERALADNPDYPMGLLALANEYGKAGRRPFVTMAALAAQGQGGRPSHIRGRTPSEGMAMRIAVKGAGGTGNYFGGLLARAGDDVTFIAGDTRLEADPVTRALFRGTV